MGTNEAPTDEGDNALTRVMDEGAQLIRTDQSTLAALNRTEIEAQLDAAHRYKRVFSRFIREAETIACTTQAVAKSCMYSLERRDKDGKKKFIIGPSIRLAEICAATYGNLHAGARPVDEDDTTVTCQGVCWDIERNVRVVTEVKRRITTSSGKRYNEDMVIVTMNACNSIAYRNAIFRVIPRALVDSIFQRVRQVAAGGAKPMDQKRTEIIAALNKLQVPTDRVLLTIGRARPEDITIEDIEILIGLGTRISENHEPIDDVFDKLVPTEGASGQPAAAAAPPPTNGNGGSATPIAEGKRQPMRRPAAAKAVTPDQREQDTQDQARAEQDDKGDDPALDHLRKKPAGDQPPPSDDDAPPWVK